MRYDPFSSTSTSRPAWARRAAATPPPAPEPTTAASPVTSASLLGRLRVPGSEKRAVARAARERRRFERGEVRRFTKRARRRRLTALAVAGSLVLLAIVVAVAAYSPLMAVRTIEITGTSRVDAGALDAGVAEAPVARPNRVANAAAFSLSAAN